MSAVKRFCPAGFSLIEMLLVLALIALITAFLAPSVSKSLTNARLTTAAKKTVVIINYARTQAVSQKKLFWVVIDRETNRLAVVSQALDRQKKQATQEKGSDLPQLFTKVYAYPDEVMIEKVVGGIEELSDSQSVFLFYPNGSSSGGEIVLKAKNARSFLITIDPIMSTAKIESNGKETG